MKTPDVLQRRARDGRRHPEGAIEGAHHGIFAPQTEKVQRGRARVPHGTEFPGGKEHPLRHRRRGTGRLERGISAAGQERVRAARS